jgi:hypothetical protein
MQVEATGDVLLEPNIDGETYKNLRKLTVRTGPRVRVPKIVAAVH